MDITKIYYLKFSKTNKILINELRNCDSMHSPERGADQRGGNEHRLPLLTKRLSIIDTCRQRKTIVSPMESYWVY